jgi:prephenate dehydrogenase
MRGPLSGRAELFQKIYILTPYSKTNEVALSKVCDLVRTLGANPVQLEAQQHDKVMGMVSHVPHLYAFALI